MCYGEIFVKNLSEREILLKELLNLWQLYGERYRTVVPEYIKLQNQVKELGLRPRAISKNNLADFPSIPFLYIEKEKNARSYLEMLSMRVLRKLKEQILDMVESNYVYRSLLAKIADYKAAIRNHDAPKLRICDITVQGQRVRCHRTSSNK